MMNDVRPLFEGRQVTEAFEIFDAPFAVSRIEFFVPGRPQTAGSKTAIRTNHGRTVVVESGDRAAKKASRQDLRAAAAEEIARFMEGSSRVWPLDAPMRVAFTFVRHRPKGHYGTGRNVGHLKPQYANTEPVQRPDALKLARHVEDALTGVLWNDDAQIVDEHLRKAWAGYGGAEGVRVAVEAMSVTASGKDRP